MITLDSGEASCNFWLPFEGFSTKEPGKRRKISLVNIILRILEMLKGPFEDCEDRLGKVLSHTYIVCSNNTECACMSISTNVKSGEKPAKYVGPKLRQ